VDILKQYTERAKEIIGERTPDEEKYDREVIRWIRRGKSIGKAIAKASEKYPTEALQIEMITWLRCRLITSTWQNTTASWRN
jgi:hypothetical protein